MYCPHCGSSVPSGSLYCSECGAKIYSDQAETKYTGPQSYDAAPQSQYVAPQPQYTQRQYEQPSPNPNPSAAGATGPLKTDRDIAMYIILSIVTCGIYGYWFIYKLAQDANVVCANDGEETPGLLVYILLSIVTCGIYSYYWTYKLANRLQNNAPRYGITITEGGSDILLWLVLGYFSCSITVYIGMHILIKNMNSICAAYNQTFTMR